MWKGGLKVWKGDGLLRGGEFPASLALKGHGREGAEGGVAPAGVGEAFNEVEDSGAGLSGWREGVALQQLALEGGEEALGERVVGSVPHRFH